MAPTIGVDSSGLLRRPRRDTLIRDKWAGRSALLAATRLDPLH